VTSDNPTNILAGDRNLSLNNVPVNPGLVSLTTNSLVGWTEKMHNKQGNDLFSDGSVQQYSSARFRSALATTGLATNRLAIP
jgi:hypothetical protein